MKQLYISIGYYPYGLPWVSMQSQEPLTLFSIAKAEVYHRQLN